METEVTETTEVVIVAASVEAEAEEAATVIATEMTNRKTIPAGGDPAATRVAATTTSHPTNSHRPSTRATEALEAAIAAVTVAATEAATDKKTVVVSNAVATRLTKPSHAPRKVPASLTPCS